MKSVRFEQHPSQHLVQRATVWTLGRICNAITHNIGHTLATLFFPALASTRTKRPLHTLFRDLAWLCSNIHGDQHAYMHKSVSTSSHKHTKRPHAHPNNHSMQLHVFIQQNACKVVELTLVQVAVSASGIAARLVGVSSVSGRTPSTVACVGNPGSAAVLLTKW